MAAGKFFGFKNTSREHMRSSIQSSIEISDIYIYIYILGVTIASEVLPRDWQELSYLAKFANIQIGPWGTVLGECVEAN